MGDSGFLLDDHLGRREALRRLGKGGLAVAGLAAMGMCKGPASPEPPSRLPTGQSHIQADSIIIHRDISGTETSPA